jgi:hypothetical protein
MKTLGLVIAIILGALLIYISNWFFLVSILVLPIIMSRIKMEYFKCPSCSYIQKDHIILDKRIRREMIHGRRTKSGKADKRFNTQYVTYVDIDFGVECQKCSSGFKTTRTYEEA